MKDLSGKNNPFYGKKHSDETKEKISETRKLRIKNGLIDTSRKKRPFMTGKNNPANRPEVREKIRQSKLGNKNPNWKGGISPINVLIRQSPEMKLWRKAVFERDNYACVWCGARNGDGKAVVLNADHIKSFADYPELRFAIDNGRTLCKDCHKKTSDYGWRRYNYKLKQKNNI